MRCRGRFLAIGITAILLLLGHTAFTAYHHGGDTDSDLVLTVYPGLVGTKLDSCALCHRGGQLGKNNVGSCQWCHATYGYDRSGDILQTLNGYGLDYLHNGRSAVALQSIASTDSDGDGYANSDEISALRFPGDSADDPTKVAAPFRVYTREELEALPQHTQFLLMNTHKSGDFYADYTGVPMGDLLDDAGILSSATGIKVYAPDGFSQYHPLSSDPDPVLYHVYGSYLQAAFYYDQQADAATGGWCDYSAARNRYGNDPSPYHGDPIQIPGGLKMLLAIKRDGEYLTPGVLNASNKLDGEGPFRVVPPQKVPGPPDQSSTSKNQNVIWPFDANADHNAGFSTRSATIIKVEPLPEGTTDINTLEAGWNFVDQSKIIVYGAIHPLPTIQQKLDDLIATLKATDARAFKYRLAKGLFILKTQWVRVLIDWGCYPYALKWLQDDLTGKVDGCYRFGSPDRNDWITRCDLQKQIYWSLYEISVLLKILA